MGLTGAWAYATFGFIAAVLMFIPWIIFFFGTTLRTYSRYDPDYMPCTWKTKGMQDEEMQNVPGRRL